MDFLRLLSDSELCRACLKRKDDSRHLVSVDALESESEKLTIRQKLAQCGTELDLSVTPNAVICTKCLSAINCTLKFKEQCVKTEKDVQGYLKKVGSSNVALNGSISAKPDLEQAYIKIEPLDDTFIHASNFEEVDVKNEFDGDTPRHHTSNSSDTEQEGINPEVVVIKDEEEEEAEECNSSDTEQEGINTEVVVIKDEEEAEESNPNIQSVQSIQRSRFNCKICGTYAASLAELILHSRVHVQQLMRVFRCTTCSLVFKDQASLDAHAMTHKKQTEDKPFKCELCDFHASRRSSVRAHMRTHTGDKPFKCDQCDFRASRKDSLTIHRRKHTGDKQYKCSLCSYRAYKRYTLTIHMRKHTGDKPYQCDLCDHRAKTKTNLIAHLRIHSSVKPFQCTECEYKSVRKSDLDIHVRSHTGEKPFRCDVCSFKSSRSTSLHSHMQLHTDDKRYRCALCNFRTHIKHSLKYHMRRHTGEKPFKCTQCDFCARTKYSLNIHVRTHDTPQDDEKLGDEENCVIKVENDD